MKNFAQVIAALVLITVVLIFAGIYFNGKRPAEITPAQQAATQARIAPVGAVYSTVSPIFAPVIATPIGLSGE